MCDVDCAKSEVRLYLNIYLNQSGAFQDKKTDRPLIYENISENNDSLCVQHSRKFRRGTEKGKNSQGISIIQVNEKANKDSFQLSGGYVTWKGSSYRYYLVAYNFGDISNSVDCDIRVFKKIAGKFLDYRLENRFL
ncbi:hypothetical protein [Bartonella doshiae]|uniref:Uncharacterized protein n=2 Tax=Bartonella doshiae TaxID=33044 RepID=A0A380ZEF9_BARDO|nr:hypothetical protein [Bartonella doshiae]EJF80574.1 hypothetical protein MCS_00921 [Bartonella doshiae NCTC 12862 = ATCC 700133]MBB6159842.1 hypothetical protein [Bartonella doshiae]SUV45358.1 Uncharacterised protein [Bartonella doshiae]